MSRRFSQIRFRLRRSLTLQLLPCFLFASLALPPQTRGPSPQDLLAQYKERFVKETDPVHRAKALTKLGDAQVADFTRRATADDFEGAFVTLNAYRDEVRSVFDGLKATGNDAEKKPDGFKELQIHLRKTLWELDRAASLVPTERRT
ncbi:MAG: hypothetical protein WAM91_15445, partial [Candidatus Acidiferrales bacterium]